MTSMITQYVIMRCVPDGVIGTTNRRAPPIHTPPLSVPARRLTGRAETLPVGFWVTGRPSGEVLPRLSLPVERKTPPEGFRWEILWFRWKPVSTGMPPEATEYHRKLFRWKNTVSGEFWAKFCASGENSVRHRNTEGGGCLSRQYALMWNYVRVSVKGRGKGSGSKVSVRGNVRYRHQKWR